MTSAGEAPWTVGEVAEWTRLSIRTLHHYDDIGLLVPSERSEANYRLYTPADVTRLYRILTYRDLGFALSEIMRLLSADAAEEQAALALQAALLQEQISQAQARLRAVTSLLNAGRTGEGARSMNKEEMQELFGGFDHTQYEDEVRERWGDTEAYRQSAQRLKSYSPADLERLKQEGAELNAKYVALMEAGVPADNPQAAQVAEAHRAYFHRWFYDCSPEMLRGVSSMWVNDPRFTRNIDKVREGLAAYQHAAVQAWASRQG
ncbi:MerR family transcriptional regulator [Deinococcus fonticola]|uniref:MerR family transcriptional regulator n=1 Tax=Deinococcus fonticola TaxID=2528713 RepID=UPI001074C07D|nr:MerR family transcriptional regulator [Deinococcus fonticola]